MSNLLKLDKSTNLVTQANLLTALKRKANRISLTR